MSTLKFFDGTKYVPAYTPPTASTSQKGEVQLTDSIGAGTDSTKATTSKAVKAHTDAIINNLTNGSTVVSKAKKLDPGASITVKCGDGFTGTTKFTGESNVTLSLTGTLPLSAIPASAQERIVTVANETARFALTSKQVQNGDIVKQTDTKILYIVKDETKLNSNAGYEEFTAGTASRAQYDINGRPLIGRITDIDVTATDDGTNGYGFGWNTDSSVGRTSFDSFQGATASAAGKQGIVPAPGVGANTKFLRGDGTWQTVTSGVSGVKGDKESSYRTGQVNLTCGNIGALPAVGGTLSGNITPNANNTLSLGSSSVKFNTVYATTFNGNATSATTANNLNKEIGFGGSVQKTTLSLKEGAATSVTLNLGIGVVGSAELSDGAVLTDRIADGAVTTAKLHENSVDTTKIINGTVTALKIQDGAVETSKIKDGSVSTAKIADANITNAKLASDIGTVYVGATEPTDTHIKIWVNTNPSTKA